MKKIFLRLLAIIFILMVSHAGTAKADTTSCVPHSNTFVSDQHTFLLDGSNAVLTYDGSRFWTHALPGTKWIWNSYFVSDPKNGEEVTFILPFSIIGSPTSAVLKVAADDYYKLLVNNIEIDSQFDDGNFLSENIHTYDLTNLLTTGANTISFKVTNAKYFWSDGATPSTNPAGLLYSLQMESLDCGSSPTTSSSSESEGSGGGGSAGGSLGTFTDSSSPNGSPNGGASVSNYQWSAPTNTSGGSDLSPQYIITSLAGSNGSITPLGSNTVGSGTNDTFTVIPNPGFQVAEVLVDGASIGPVHTYTFNNIKANHTISASFSKKITSTLPASAGAPRGGVESSPDLSHTHGLPLASQDVSNQTAALDNAPGFSAILGLLISQWPQLLLLIILLILAYWLYKEWKKK